MNAIKKVRLYIEANPGARESKVLAHLAAALADERPFALADLYALDLEAFDLALDLMRDWRLDRYYAARLKLLDTIVAGVLPELGQEAAAPAVATPAPKPASASAARPAA
jgi:hypothetical protein